MGWVYSVITWESCLYNFGLVNKFRHTRQLTARKISSKHAYISLWMNSMAQDFNLAVNWSIWISQDDSCRLKQVSFTYKIIGLLLTLRWLSFRILKKKSCKIYSKWSTTERLCETRAISEVILRFKYWHFFRQVRFCETFLNGYTIWTELEKFLPSDESSMKRNPGRGYSLSPVISCSCFRRSAVCLCVSSFGKTPLLFTEKAQQSTNAVATINLMADRDDRDDIHDLRFTRMTPEVIFPKPPYPFIGEP